MTPTALLDMNLKFWNLKTEYPPPEESGSIEDAQVYSNVGFTGWGSGDLDYAIRAYADLESTTRDLADAIARL